MFMVGDPGQRIYKGRSSWSAVGINVRGRATRLRVNYRTTEQIRQFSERLIGSRDDGDGDSETEGRETISKLSGPEPELRGFDSVDAEIAGVAQWLAGFIEQGYRPRDIAVFARTDGVLVERAQAALEAAGLGWARLQDEEMLTDEVAAVGTMHRAKGLEFKIVAVMGCERGLVPLGLAVREAVDPADREDVVAQERGLLYVACTRARERVLVSWVGSRSEFL